MIESTNNITLDLNKEQIAAAKKNPASLNEAIRSLLIQKVMLKEAIDSTMLVRQINREAERLQLKLGGRYFARPRYGCWNTTPTVRDRRNHVDALVK